MTLVLTAHGHQTLWVLTDRRLSYGSSRPPRDDGTKVMVLETADGVGILAYAGLGATSLGMEPSAWMSNVLRGRSGLSFEQALAVVAEAAKRELPKHLRGLPYPGHFILAPAWIRDEGARAYSIDNVLDATGNVSVWLVSP